MSDTVTPMGNARAAGIATVREIGPQGMITLRARPGTEGLEAALRAITGTALPERRAILHNGDRAAGWMSPDEYLLVLPHAEVPAAVGTLSAALAGRHHLAVDVSDARALFRIEGDRADEVAMTLFPLDFPSLGEGELRRTRMAQVAAALWRQDGGLTVVTFRSVARYAFDLLANAARA
ncbi:MAG: sarcosine oxidase subunit gamma [Paracoccaceae bacterium]|nr:MAG: sarcosine oxidase subunit gamma [Paracoccaceae bacterium]